MGQVGESFGQLLSGFSSMQAALGLLPVQNSQAPMGVPVSAMPPPPPPLHPGDFSNQLMQQTQMMMQPIQMVQQQSRPAFNGPTWGSTVQAMQSQQVNPYMASAMSGGQSSFPSPMYNMPNQFGMYRPGGSPGPTGGVYPTQVPSIYNPAAAHLPPAQFGNQYARDFAINRQQQGQAAAGLAAAFQGGGEMLGGVAGGAIGQMLLPIPILGEMAGQWAGAKIGGAMGSMASAAFGDMTRGARLQNMTAPYMVSGSSLDPFTGRGLSRQGGVDLAAGLRHTAMDSQFHRQTGYNTEDMMRLTQLSGDQGLLATSQDPQGIARKMKDIAKAVKALVDITGDPDVKNAISSLGNMRNLGFEGLGGQMGALYNRKAFARMAGVSQQSMNDQYGMPGAAVAQGIGLAGATGYMAGMQGAAMGNVAMSGGAFNDLQASRAGGKGGISQTFMQAMLGSQNNDQYMLAAMEQGTGGKMRLNIDKYNKLHQMGFDDVQQMAASNANRLGQGKDLGDILAGLKNEMKDSIQQHVSPLQQQANMIGQITQFQKGLGPNSSFLQAANLMLTGQGMGGDDASAMARTLDLAYSSGSLQRGMQQQQGQIRRDRHQQERALSHSSDRGGFLTRLGTDIRDTVGGIGDAAGRPFRSLARNMDEVSEDHMAFEHGERITRRTEGELASTPAEVARVLHKQVGSQFKERVRGYGAPAGVMEGVSNTANVIGGALGLTSYNSTNKMRALIGESEGGSFLGGSNRFITAALSVGKGNAEARVAATMEASEYISGGQALADSEGAMTAARTELSSINPKLDLNKFNMSAASSLKEDLRVGHFGDHGAMDATQLRKAGIKAIAEQNGGDVAAATAAYDKNPDKYSKMLLGHMLQDSSVGDDVKEVIKKTQRVAADMKTVMSGDNYREKAHDYINDKLGVGLFGVSEEQADALSGAIKTEDPKALAVRAIQEARKSEEISESTMNERIAEIQKGMSGDEAASLMTKASKINLSIDQKKAAVGVAGRWGQTGKSLMDAFSSVKDVQEQVAGGDVRKKMATAFEATDDQSIKALGLGSMGDTTDMLSALAGLGDDAINKLPDAVKAAVMAKKNGSSDAQDLFDQAAGGYGGGAKTEAGAAVTKQDMSDADAISALGPAAGTFKEGVDRFEIVVNNLLVNMHNDAKK